MLESAKPSYGLARDAKVKLVESKQPASKTTLDNGYEIDDDLLILAGLKK